MREGVAICVLFLFLANGLMVSGNGGADGAGSGAHERAASRAVTLIYDVYDLQNMSLDLSGSYELANDIDASATAGWNSGAGFNPVGNNTYKFSGSLDGKNHTISGLFINRSGTDPVGLFGYVSSGGSVCCVGIVNCSVTGSNVIGGLVGSNEFGTVTNSYAIGNVTGNGDIGGLVGVNDNGMVNNSYAAANVNGDSNVGGLVGFDARGTVCNSHSTGNVTATGDDVGGLVGDNHVSQITNCYSTGNVTGKSTVGGLVGENFNCTVENSYAAGNVNGTGDYVGGLVGGHMGTLNNSHATGNVSGRDYVGGLAGENDWNDAYGIVNNAYATGNVNGSGEVGGLVGYNFNKVDNAYATGNVNGTHGIGGLVGDNGYETVNNSHATGTVTGIDFVGGLTGYNNGIVSNSYATGNVNGSHNIGGLMPSYYDHGTVYNSHYDIDNVSINGGTYVTLGGLFDGQYEDWISSGLTLNISDYSTNLVHSGEYYDINTTQGLRDLLGFAEVAGYKFRLTADIDLSAAPGLYIPDLAAEFDGDNHTISNLDINMSFAADVGLFGYNDGGTIQNTGLVYCDVNAYANVGGLVGGNRDGTVSNSYARGIVTGTWDMVGGLMGFNMKGEVSTSFASVKVTGRWCVGGLLGYSWSGTEKFSYASGNVTGDYEVGGLMGNNDGGTVDNSYATGNVTGTSYYIGGLVGIITEGGTINNSYAAGKAKESKNVGGLVGYIYNGTVSNCFWDNETSGINSSYGGTGKTTAEMKTRSTFTDAGWDFNNTWCMVENVTYPLFEWQLDVLPKANAGLDQTVYEGTLVTLDGSSSTDGIDITNYTWAFNDGTDDITLHGVAPSHTFNVSGVYGVILNITDAFGRWDTDALTVTVKKFPQPIADAGPDQTVEVGARVSFNGSGSTSGAGIVNYTWAFNDGTGNIELYGAAPSHTFNLPGVYAVRLNVTDARRDWAIDMMNVTVNDMTPPAADAGPDQVVDQGSLVTFDGSGSRDNVGIVNYSWELIDGAPVTLNGVRPAYRFDHPGIFVVTLNVSDAAGNRGTDTMTVTVIDVTAPVADAGPDQTVDQGTVMTLNGSGSSDNVGVVNFTWTFTDGVPITLSGARPTYKFDNPGIILVKLKVEDAAGNTDTDTMTVTVKQVNVTVKDIIPPVADAGPDQTIDVGTLMMFNGSGSIDHVGVVNFTWTFTDGVPVTLFGARPTYRFDNPGIFLVTLNVTDAAGNWGIGTVTVTVSPKPVPPSPEKPQCTIVYPLNGSKVGGRMIIRGTAINGTLPLTIIQVRIDGGDWMTAIGLKNWTLSVNLGQAKNGGHTIEARAFDGSLYSDTASVRLTVDNPEPSVSSGGSPWCLPVIIVAVVAGLGVLLVLRKKIGGRPAR